MEEKQNRWEKDNGLQGVGIRACYLLCRLIRVVRSSLTPFIPDLLSVLQPLLNNIATTPRPEPPTATKSAPGIGAHQSQNRFVSREYLGTLLKLWSNVLSACLLLSSHDWACIAIAWPLRAASIQTSLSLIWGDEPYWEECRKLGFWYFSGGSTKSIHYANNAGLFACFTRTDVPTNSAHWDQISMPMMFQMLCQVVRSLKTTVSIINLLWYALQ